MKRTVHRLLSLLLAGIVAGHLLLAGAAPAMAQFFDESLESADIFAEDEDQFFEHGMGQDDIGAGGTAEPDFTEGERFVDESLVPSGQRGLSLGSRQLQLTLGKDRDILPLNIAWGAGTGLLLGGWFALIAEGDNRDTQRSIGVGIVAGILMGVAVGTRTLFNPDAPRPTADAPRPAADGPTLTPIVALSHGTAQVGIRLTF